ncbi:hypothetical protein LCGC14_1948340, partial [marine sediment metagenome]
QWILTGDRQHIEWDGGEKFYGYVEWIEYIIEKILKPRSYVLNGKVEWSGEDEDDFGTILVINNKVEVIEGEFDELEELMKEKLEKIKNNQ